MLASLYVKNFRVLEDFQVSKLGRVNLIVGKNNSGKSSVLEALRIYAGNAQASLLEAIAGEHNERSHLAENPSEEADGPLPFEEFLSGRQLKTDGENTILIGESPTHPDLLRIEYGALVESRTELTDERGQTATQLQMRFSPVPELATGVEDALVPSLRVTKRGSSRHIRFDRLRPVSPFRRRPQEPLGGELPCSVLPTQFISLDQLADLWDRIALTPQEHTVSDALRIISSDFEALTFVRNDRGDLRGRPLERTARVKLRSYNRLVPLNSLGDGMVRVLQLTLKMFPARGGFYLIDEFENGLHFSVQEKVWRLLFTLAAELDIQLFATTHSWDCIESFARVARDVQDVEGLLFRVGRSVRTSDRNRVIATVFEEEQLYNITQADVEVR